MSTDITRARPERLSALSGVLGRGFVNEPMLLWSLGTHGDVAARFTRFFESFNAPLARQGMLWEAEAGAGTALWIPADAGEEYGRALDACRTDAHALSDDGGLRFDTFWEWVETKVPSEPVWHLDSIAVEPESRGKGIGAALIAFGLDLAGADGRGVFLETGTPSNVPYYEEFGFRTIDDGNAPGGGPQIWFMLWEAGVRS